MMINSSVKNATAKSFTRELVDGCKTKLTPLWPPWGITEHIETSNPVLWRERQDSRCPTKSGRLATKLTTLTVVGNYKLSHYYVLNGMYHCEKRLSNCAFMFNLRNLYDQNDSS